MSVIIKGFDKPEDCLGCPFLSELEEISVGSDGLYKKIGYCKFVSDIMPDLEDPWHDMEWLYNHTEEWCPITQINENGTPYTPSGEWIYKPTWDNVHKSRTCNKCGYHEVVFPNEADLFCPNCGAKMSKGGAE